MFELGKDLLDWIEVGRVGRQEQAMCASLFDGASHGPAFVTAKVVHDDDVTGCKRWHQKLFDVASEYFAIDWPLDHTGGINPVMAQGGEKRCRAPGSVWNFCKQTLAARAPATQRRHVGFGPRLVNKNQAGRVNLGLMPFPSCPLAHDVRAILLAREYGFFYG